MSDPVCNQNQDSFGCCQGDPADPVIYNRPGKSTLDYRIGTYSLFFKRMLRSLPREEISEGQNSGAHPLAALGTRELDDPAIAILDAWAVTADVLTFYQERIANEGYLRTATERRSIMELARAIGYELSPGVAAGAYLAFTVEDMPGSPESAVIPKGNRVQSIPGQGQLPQAFETSYEITARAKWNALRPRMTQPQPMNSKASAIYIDGLNSDLKTGGYILFVPSGNGGNAEAKMIKDVTLEDKLKRTKIELEGREKPTYTAYTPGGDYSLQSLKTLILNNDNVDSTIKGRAWEEKDLAAFIAIQGWDERSVIDNISRTATRTPKVRSAVSEVAKAITSEGTNLGGDNEANKPGDEPMLYAFKVQINPFGYNAPRWDSLPVSQRYYSESNGKPVPYPGSWDDPEPSIINTSAIGGSIHVSDIKDSIDKYRINDSFGIKNFINANIIEDFIESHKINDTIDADKIKNLIDAYKVTSLVGMDKFKDFVDADKIKDFINANFQVLREFYSDADFFLERNLPDLVKDSWMLLKRPDKLLPDQVKLFPCQVKSVVERSPTDFALSAKATGVILNYPIQDDGNVIEKKEDLADFKLRSTTIYALSQPLTLAALPIDDAIGSGLAEASQITLDGMVMGLSPGQAVAITGECQDLEGVIYTEVVFLSQIIHKDGFTTIFFDPKLQHTYIRSTVIINANLVAATHGGTVHEVLGSGDGSLANQKFVLKKPPLTYISASNSTGRESTLGVSVNGVAWKEVSQLYGLDGKSENFMVRIDDDQKATVIFGDGNMGARPATGMENIIAAYRSGIGRTGMLEKDKLTLLPSRPLGIQGVTNPLPTSGAAEAESRDQARSNASRSVQILDRIVSLQDFEDFSCAFPGIGKARAVSVEVGEDRLVHITIAASEPIAGSASSFSPATHLVESSSELYINLVNAIKGASDSIQHFVVDTYQPLFFNLSARLLIDERLNAQAVLANVDAELKSTFSFESRDFGQQATAAEAIAVMQRVSGVNAVYLDKFFNTITTTRRSLTVAIKKAPTKLRSATNVRYQTIGFDEVLEAGDAELIEGKWWLAELLLINPLGIDLKVVES